MDGSQAEEASQAWTEPAFLEGRHLLIPEADLKTPLGRPCALRRL